MAKQSSPDDRNAEKQRRYRARLKQHQLIAPVPVNEAIINLVIRTGWLSERDATKRKLIGEAIARLLTEAEHRYP